MHSTSRRRKRLFPDITERFYSMQAQFGGDIIAVLDAGLHVSACAGVEQLGWSVRSLVGRGMLSLVHADDEAPVREALLATGRTGVHACGRVQHRDGSWRRLAIAGFWERSHGEPQCLLRAREIGVPPERAAAGGRSALHETDVNAALRAWSDDLQSSVGLSCQRVWLQLGDEVSAAAIRADALRQIVFHLVSNAREATEPFGRIVLATRNETRTAAGEQQEGVVLEVADNGFGIAAHARERIFEPFFTTRPPLSAAGLGLTVVAALVEEAGGTVSFESALARGTTFTIWLPRAARRVPSETQAIFRRGV